MEDPHQTSVVVRTRALPSITIAFFSLRVGYKVARFHDRFKPMFRSERSTAGAACLDVEAP
jgi:hypothetical protein